MPRRFPAVTWTHERAVVAGLKRRRAEDDPEVVEAVRALQQARLDEHIERLVASAPPLSEAQRSRLAVLLRSNPGGEVAA